MKKLLAVLLTIIMALGCIGAPIITSAANPYLNAVKIESVFFTDGNNMTVIDPAGKSDLIPYVVLSKPVGAGATITGVNGGGTIVVATYENGVIHDVAFAVMNDSSLVHADTGGDIERPTYKTPAINYPASGGSVKAFLWNGANGIEPYSPSIDDSWAVPASQQPTGEIKFPEPFKSKLESKTNSGKINQKITITKNEGARNYSHDATPDSIMDWSDATEIFLSSTVDFNNSVIKARTGLLREEPICGSIFATNFKAGMYKKADGNTIQDKFIYTLLDDFHTGAGEHSIPFNNLGSYSSATNLGADVNINALVRSGSPSEFTWIGRIRRQNNANEITTQWAPVPDKAGVYSTIQVTNQSILTLFNFNKTDEYGVPRPYVLVNSIDEVAAKKGTFFQNTTTVYCNPYDGHNLADITLVLQAGLLDGIRNAFDKNVIFQNIGFVPQVTANNVNNWIQGVNSETSVISFFGCKFSGSATNVLALNTKYTAYLFDCVAAYGFRDGFNYHATITAADNPTVIEVNCKSYFNGDTNRITGSAEIDRVAESSTATNVSNNASTAHDGVYMLRVGGRYWWTEGPIVADESCYSISIGCETYNFDWLSPSERTAFLMYDATNPNRDPVNGRKKYIVDCMGTGTKLRSGAVGNANTYILDFVGNTRLTIGNANDGAALTNTTTWAKIMSGAWEE